MHLKEATRNILKDLRLFLESVDGSAYTTPLEILSKATIGQHSRHTIEFFQCLVEQQKGGTVNYDLRKRDSTIESQPEAALEALNKIELQLQNQLSNKPVKLEISLTNQNGLPDKIDSSFFREWTYVLEHAVHHMAIIRIGLSVISPQQVLPESFGIAPSTIKYRQQCAP